MCIRIISNRLPVRLLTAFKCGPETKTNFTYYYLTCGANFRRNSSRAPDCANRPNCLLNTYLCSRRQVWRCGFSSLPKGDAISKAGMISNVPPPGLQQATAVAKGASQKDEVTEGVDPKKLGLFARFKLMYRQYWYVLIPVHVVTSIGWFGGFYYLSQSGVDIPSLLETMRVSETVIDKLRDSTMGHLAIAYLCYKISTPLRYMVTLGGTTVSIKYLEHHGYIKPMPTKSQLMQMYEDKKADRARRKQERTKDD